MVGFGHRARSRVNTSISYMILLTMFGNKNDSRARRDLNLIYPALLAQKNAGSVSITTLRYLSEDDERLAVQHVAYGITGMRDSPNIVEFHSS